MTRKKIDYSTLFTLRKDGLYMGYWHDADGIRHAMYDRNPEALFAKLEQAKSSLTKKPPTFREIADEWETIHRERIGYKTAEAYTAPLRRLKEKYGDTPASELSPQMVYAYLTELAKRGYSRRSVQMHRDIVNMIYNNAIVAGRATANPTAAISLPRNLPTTKRQLPDDEAIKAVREKTDHPFALFALVCLYAGLRRGEALALRYEDIDRASKVIHITKAIEFLGNSPHIKTPKTTAGTRDAVLLDALAALLPQSKKGYIFCRDDGSPLTKMQYRKRWLSYCQYIGHNITAHQLRHGFATILYEAGIPDKDAQELMGHSSIQVTRDIYTHIRQSRRQDTAEALNQYLML